MSKYTLCALKGQFQHVFFKLNYNWLSGSQSIIACLKIGGMKPMSVLFKGCLSINITMVLFSGFKSKLTRFLGLALVQVVVSQYLIQKILWQTSH